MDEIRERLYEEQQRSLLLSDTRLLTQPIHIDNHLVHSSLQSTKLQLIEQNNNDVYIIWFTTEQNNDHHQLLNGINIQIFYSNHSLVDFISELQTSNVFLIIDYELVSQILSLLDDFSQIIFVYILKNEKSDENIIIMDSKRSIRKSSHDKQELFQWIIEDIDTCTKDSICSTIFDLTITEESTNQIKNTSSIWYYLLIESLFDMTVYNENAKQHLIEYCRQQYSPNDIQQQNLITQFENEYLPENAIHWYTRDSFIYRQLNKALRIRDIDVIFKFRFFIIDFQKQLEQHYNEQMNQSLHTVYRGQLMSQLELIKLKNSVGKYISFNTYLSASTDKDVALVYASGSLSILFEIETTGNLSTSLKDKKRVRPVYVQDKSCYPSELEVIFPIGSSFLVESIRTENDRCHIKLKLIDDDHYNEMIELIQTMYMKNIPSKLRFANLLVSSGDYDKAERYIEMLIEDLKLSSDNENIAYVYDLLGRIWYERGDYDRALTYFEKALNNTHLENTFVATIYRHIGCSYRDKNKYDIALKYLQQALEYEHNMDSLELAELYEALGSIYRDMKHFENALSYTNQALAIRQSNLSSEAALGFTYASLAFIYLEKCDYTEALQLFTSALSTLSEILPKSHPYFIYLYAFIGHSHSGCLNVSSAMIYLQKALHSVNMTEKKQNLNPTIHIFICNVLFSLYELEQDITNSFYYAQEAYNIYDRHKNIIPDTYFIIRVVYRNLGKAYYNFCDYSSALSFFSKALIGCTDINTQILILSNIGQTYLQKDDVDMSLHHFNNALKLYSQANLSTVNMNTVFWIHSYLSDVYKLKNNLEKSIFYAEEALRSEVEQTNKSISNIVDCYIHLMQLCPEKRKEYIEETLDMVQKHDLPVNSKISYHHAVGRFFYVQGDNLNALYHFELCLKNHLTYIRPCYQDLIHVYASIGDLYQRIQGEDSDLALLHFEKSRDIYFELLNQQEIPIKDKSRCFSAEGYILDNINQSSTLIFRIFLVYNQIVKYYIKKENKKQALNHLHTMEQIINNYNGKKKLMDQDTIYRLIGYLYELMEDYDKAIFLYEKNLTYISKDYNKYGSTYQAIARTYFKKQDYLMAISKYKIALTFLHNSQSTDYNTLAKCYEILFFSYKGIKNEEYALIIFEQIPKHYLLCNHIDYDRIVYSYINCAGFIYSLKRWDCQEAIEYLLPAIKFTQHNLKNDVLEKLYFLLGMLHIFNRKYKIGLFYCNKSLKYSRASDDILRLYNVLQIIYTLTGQFDQALHIMKRKIDIQFSLETVNFIKVSQSYDDMGFIYYQLGKYKVALKYYRIAFVILEIYQNDRQNEAYSRIYSEIAYIYYAYGQIEDALQLCFKARNTHLLSRENRYIIVNIYILLALIECKRGNYYTALDYLGQVWEYIYNEDLPYYRVCRVQYNYIGYVYFKLDQKEIAMKNYMKSLSLYNDCQKHPDLAEVYKNIGLIYEQDEITYPNALLYYKRALETLPNNKYPRYILYKSMIITLESKLKKKITRKMSI